MCTNAWMDAINLTYGAAGARWEGEDEALVKEEAQGSGQATTAAALAAIEGGASRSNNGRCYFPPFLLAREGGGEGRCSGGLLEEGEARGGVVLPQDAEVVGKHPVFVCREMCVWMRVCVSMRICVCIGLFNETCMCLCVTLRCPHTEDKAHARTRGGRGAIAAAPAPAPQSAAAHPPVYACVIRMLWPLANA